MRVRTCDTPTISRPSRLRTIAAALLLALIGSEPVSGTGVEGEGFCSCTERRCASNSPCVPCKPHRLIVGGAVLPDEGLPSVLLYVVKARTRGHGRTSLRGKLQVHAHLEPGAGPQQWPGFPRTCDSEVCLGRTARLRGALLPGRRFAVTARYRDGAKCDLTAPLEWTSHGGAPGEFTCWDAAGEALATGALNVQLIRASHRGRSRGFCGQ